MCVSNVFMKIHEKNRVARHIDLVNDVTSYFNKHPKTSQLLVKSFQKLVSPTIACIDYSMTHQQDGTLD